jgi:hypothetical protein
LTCRPSRMGPECQMSGMGGNQTKGELRERIAAFEGRSAPLPSSCVRRHGHRTLRPLVARIVTIHAGSRATPLVLPSNVPQEGKPRSRGAELETALELAPLVRTWPGGEKWSSDEAGQLGRGWEPGPDAVPQGVA